MKWFFLLSFFICTAIFADSALTLFYSKLYRKETPWIKKQITHDFSPFLNQGIQKEGIVQTHKKWAKEGSIYRYRIVQNQIYQRKNLFDPSLDDKRNADQFVLSLIQLKKRIFLPDVEILVSMKDGFPEINQLDSFKKQPLLSPVFAQASIKKAKAVVLIPDYFVYEYWPKMVSNMKKLNRKYPWKKKKNSAFWRGSNSDKHYTIDNYQKKPRYIISKLSREFPHLIDAGYNQVRGEVAFKLEEEKLIKSTAKHSEHFLYKYLPNLDGYICTYPGFLWRLLSHSLACKQESNEIQWYYRALEPYLHYLPIKEDMSNFLSQLAWAKEHDKECEKIAKRATRFVLTQLHSENMYVYLYKTLKKCSLLEKKGKMDIRKKEKKTGQSKNWQVVG